MTNFKIWATTTDKQQQLAIFILIKGEAGVI